MNDVGATGGLEPSATAIGRPSVDGDQYGHWCTIAGALHDQACEHYRTAYGARQNANGQT